MVLCFNKLWKLLIDKGINKTQLKDQAKISTNVVAKLGRNQTVALSTIEKIFKTLDRSIEDIAEFIVEESPK